MSDVHSAGTPGTASGSARDRIALWLLFGSMSILVIAAIGVLLGPLVDIIESDDRRLVFTTMTGLIGTWVGAVIAFYFGRENFEAATKSLTKTIDRLSSDERLAQVPVGGLMITRDKMVAVTLAAGQAEKDVLLADMKTKFDSATEISRLPVLNADGSVRGMVHESLFDKYLAADPARLQGTLADLLTDADHKAMYTRYATVKPGQTMLDAKQALDRVAGAHDVFVTSTGTPQGKVEGWLTNNDILRALVV